MFYFIFNEYKGLSVNESLSVKSEKIVLCLTLMSFIIISSSLLIVKKDYQTNPNGWGAMKYPQLVLGMLAIFIYVGVGTIGSNLGELLKSDVLEIGILTEKEITPYISMYWGGLMIGRWTEAITVFNNSKMLKIIIHFSSLSSFRNNFICK